MKDLSFETDLELVELVKKSSSSEAFCEICKRYEDIFYNVCQKFTYKLINAGLSADDIFEEKNTIILHCISTYDPSKKAKLGTWIGNYARYLCLNSINDRRFILPSTEEDLIKRQEESLIFATEEKDTRREDEINEVLSLISQIKDKRITQILKYRYGGDKKMIWSDIAKIMGISTQTVISYHNAGIKYLRRRVNKLNIPEQIIS